jgi:phosphate transport system substrate-binding protein
MVIRGAGLVDQMPERIAVNIQGNWFADAILFSDDGVSLAELQRMVALMEPMARLTTSFRFEAG